MAKDELISQSDNSLAPAKSSSLLHLKGKRAVIVAGVLTVWEAIAPVFDFGRATLDWLQRADFLSKNSADILRWFISPRGAQIFFALFCATFILAVYRTINSKETTAQAENKLQSAEQPQPDDDVEKLQDRITELEGEKSSLEKRIERLASDHHIENQNLQSKHQVEINAREREITAEKRQCDVLQKRLTEKEKYDWLTALATVHANDISDYVEVERLYFCYHELTDDIPFIVFGVDIFNKSVFNITIENSMDGHIEIAGKPLLRDKRFTHHPSKISPMSEGKLTIEQRLSPEEAALIAKCDESKFGSFFYFDKLTVMIGSGTQFPRFERTRLILPKFLGSKDTPAATEIASLKSQLEELRRRKVTFEVSRQSQVHYTYIEEVSYFVANILVQFENTDRQDLTMRGIDVSLYEQDESGEEKQVETRTRNLTIMRHPAMSNVDFSRGLKLIAGEQSDFYWFIFQLELYFVKELSPNCFLRVTMSAMNQDPYWKDYDIDDWDAAQHSNSYISERRQAPSQNVGSTPNS